MTVESSANSQQIFEPLFVAELTPHRSLSRSGFTILMAIVILLCFSSGVMFLSLGAWPVFIFLLIDIAIIYGAFRLNFRSGKIKERIILGRDRLVVEKISSSGAPTHHHFNPFGTSFEINRHEEYGIMDMYLKSRDRLLQIGSFLNPDDREDFSVEFSKALFNAKR